MLLKKNLINLLVILLALGFLLFWLWLAWNGAKLRQQAEVVEKNAFALRQGMEYFFNDYDRFPQSAEFQAVAGLSPYFSAFPPRNFVSKICSSGSFHYVRPSLSRFELDFCTPAATQKSKTGWNKLVSD